MNIYLIFSIISLLVFVSSIIILVFIIKDEKNLKEVSNAFIKSKGKEYTKIEYENEMFQIYKNIIFAKENNDYISLRDLVSDEEYNKILLELKSYQDKNLKHTTTNINKDFSKLIIYEEKDNFEIAKLWIKYISTEYILNKDNEIISGSKDKSEVNEYIITFVKTKTNTESITCPSCGYQTKILSKSKCPRCESEIVPKKMHWVYIGKEKV